MHQDQEDTHQRLNAQTAKIQWDELQKHFALGMVIKVAPQLDLIQVASRLIDDDKSTFEGWISRGEVAKATDDDARIWLESQPTFWAVVVAPWVLVQTVPGDAAAQ